MASPVHPTLVAFALVGSLFAACGGKTAVDLTGTGSSGGSSGGSGGSSGGSGGSSGTPSGGSSGVTGGGSGAPSSASSTGGSSASSGGGPGTSSGGSSGSPTVMCVDINPAAFDQTCSQSSDCFPIMTGTICTAPCLCVDDAAINASEAYRYQAEVAPVITAIGACGCRPPRPPVCSGNRCIICQGAPSDPPECGSNCPDIPTLLASMTCASGGCHDSTTRAQGLDLQSPNVAARLVGVPSMEGPGLLIDPSNPSASVLYTKETASPPFGARMPFGLPPLDDATLACLLAWVTQQADSVMSIDASAPIVCMQGRSSISPSGGGGDSGFTCSLQTTESCSDGTTYTATCTAPDGMCTCSESSGNMGGSSGGGVTVMFPPGLCGPTVMSPVGPAIVDLAYAACGFPIIR